MTVSSRSVIMDLNVAALNFIDSLKLSASLFGSFSPVISLHFNSGALFHRLVYTCDSIKLASKTQATWKGFGREKKC